MRCVCHGAEDIGGGEAVVVVVGLPVSDACCVKGNHTGEAASTEDDDDDEEDEDDEDVQNAAGFPETNGASLDTAEASATHIPVGKEREEDEEGVRPVVGPGAYLVGVLLDGGGGGTPPAGVAYGKDDDGWNADGC